MTHQMPLLHSGTQRNHKDFSSDVPSNAVLVWHQMQNFLENYGCSPCAPAEARRWTFFDFSQGNLENLVGNLEGIFRRFSLSHRTKAQTFRGKFRCIFRKKIRGSKKTFVQNSLCRRATLNGCGCVWAVPDNKQWFESLFGSLGCLNCPEIDSDSNQRLFRNMGELYTLLFVSIPCGSSKIYLTNLQTMSAWVRIPEDVFSTN